MWHENFASYDAYSALVVSGMCDAVEWWSLLGLYLLVCITLDTAQHNLLGAFYFLFHGRL